MVQAIEVVEYLKKLEHDVGIEGLYEQKEKRCFFLPFGERNILIWVNEHALLFNSLIGTMPHDENEKELLALHLLNANYLGQGTGQSAIGLSPDRHTISLTMEIPGIIDYFLFKERLEEFVNYHDYWSEEIEQKKIRDLK